MNFTSLSSCLSRQWFITHPFFNLAARAERTMNRRYYFSLIMDFQGMNEISKILLPRNVPSFICLLESLAFALITWGSATQSNSVCSSDIKSRRLTSPLSDAHVCLLLICVELNQVNVMDSWADDGNLLRTLHNSANNEVQFSLLMFSVYPRLLVHVSLRPVPIRQQKDGWIMEIHER